MSQNNVYERRIRVPSADAAGFPNTGGLDPAGFGIRAAADAEERPAQSYDISRVFRSHVYHGQHLHRSSSLGERAECRGERPERPHSSRHFSVRHPEESELSDYVAGPVHRHGPHGNLLLVFRHVSGGVGAASVRSAHGVEDEVKEPGERNKAR